MKKELLLIGSLFLSSTAGASSPSQGKNELIHDAEAHGRRGAAQCEGIEFESSELVPDQDIGRSVVYFRNRYHSATLKPNDCLADPENNLENRKADGSKNCFTTRESGKPIIGEKVHAKGGIEQTVLIVCH